MLQRQQQQHTDQTKLRAIDVGGTAEQSMADLWEMPVFPLFRDNLTTNKHHPFGQWFWQQAPQHLLRNICVNVDNDREFDQLLQLLHKLPSAQNRRFFGVQFDGSIKSNSFAGKLQPLMSLLREKAPALDTLCLVLKMCAAPEMLNVLANQMHPNVATFCVEGNGLIRYACLFMFTYLTNENNVSVIATQQCKVCKQPFVHCC